MEPPDIDFAAAYALLFDPAKTAHATSATCTATKSPLTAHSNVAHLHTLV